MSQKGLLMLHSQEGPRWCPRLGLELETELELGWRGLSMPQIMILLARGETCWVPEIGLPPWERE